MKSLATISLASATLLFSTLAVQAEESGKITYNGDLRLRYENDFASQKNNRNRLRLRARFTLHYKPEENWDVGVRFRTGNHRSQQSPHLTFLTSEGSPDDFSFVFDKLFVQYRNQEFQAWLGRNSFPFWTPNELFWDSDVTPTGAAIRFNHDFANSSLETSLAAMILPDGALGLHQPILGAQLKYEWAPKENFQLILSPAFHYMFGREDDHTFLLDKNGERDYAIGALNTQLTSHLINTPITLGADLYHNFIEQDWGFTFSTTLGKLKSPGDWLFSYTYAHLEPLAVNASYAQDDWLRFGNGRTGQTQSSGFFGHELRAAYQLSESIDLTARLFLTNSISSGQNSNRFRLDVNIKF